MMKRDNDSASALYQPADFRVLPNARILDHIYAGRLPKLRDSEITGVFGTPPPDARRVYRALVSFYYNHVKSIDTDGFLNSFDEPREGGMSAQETIDGRAVSLDFLKSVEQAYSIRKAWTLAGNSGTPQLIVELGGGYGRLAYVCRKMMNECIYVLLDLPEAPLCAHEWLSSVLPEGEVIPYRQARSLGRYSRVALSGSSVWTLGAHAIEQVEEADVFVCIHYFAAMSAEATTNYLIHIDRMASVLYSQVERERDGLQERWPGEMAFRPHPHWTQLFCGVATPYYDFVEAAYRLRS